VKVFKDTKGDRSCSRVPLLLEKIVVDGPGLIEGSGRSEETTRVEEVQAEHRQEDHGTVHSVEVDFGGDDPAFSTVDELDGSVHGSDVEGEGAESRSKEHRLHVLVHEVAADWWLVIRTLEGLVGEITVDELDGEDHVDDDGEQLEDNTAQHDFTTLFWFLIVISNDGGECTTNALNGESDKISSEKDDGIWR